MRRLTAKVAIITGAASGIGRATALRFAAEGAAVVIADVNRAAGNSCADEITAASRTEAPFLSRLTLAGNATCSV